MSGLMRFTSGKIVVTVFTTEVRSRVLPAYYRSTQGKRQNRDEDRRIIMPLQSGRRLVDQSKGRVMLCSFPPYDSAREKGACLNIH